MDYWWFIIFIAAFVVAMAGYFLWKQFFVRPQDASGAGAAGSTPDHHDRHQTTNRADRIDQRDARNTRQYRNTGGTENPGTPLS